MSITQDIINLSTSFNNASNLLSNINMGFISFFSTFTNPSIIITTKTIKQIITSGLLELISAFKLTSDTLLEEIPLLSTKSLSIAFYNIYNASYNINLSFQELFKKMNTITISNFISYDQSYISLNNIISNFNNLSINLSNASKIVSELSIINSIQSLFLSKSLLDASISSLNISKEFKIFQDDFYVSKINSGESIINKLIAIPNSFLEMSYSFQEAYITLRYFSIIPDANMSQEPLNKYLLNISNIQLLIANLYNKEKITLFENVPISIIDTIIIINYQIGYVYLFLSNNPNNVELYCLLKDLYKLLNNITTLFITDMELYYIYSPLNQTNITIYNSIAKNYKDISNYCLMISTIKNIININSAELYKQTFSSISETILNISKIYETIGILKTKTEIINNMQLINIEYSILAIEHEMLYTSVGYIYAETLDITYPIINVNEEAITNITNILINLSNISKSISKEFTTILIDNTFSVSPLSNNIIKNNEIILIELSEIFLEGSIILKNFTLEKFYNILYEIYLISNNLSNNFNIIYNYISTIPISTLTPSIDLIYAVKELMINFNNYAQEFNNLGMNIHGLNLPSYTNSLLILSMNTLSNISQNIGNIFGEIINVSNSINNEEFIKLFLYIFTSINIDFTQYAITWNNAFIAIYYISSNNKTIEYPTSFSSSLSTISYNINNISLGFSSLFYKDSNTSISIITKISLAMKKLITLNYSELSILFMMASNATNEKELSIAFNQINAISKNIALIMGSFVEDFTIISPIDIIADNDEILFDFDNITTNYNLMSASLIAASTSINILQFNILSSDSFSVSLNGASESIIQVASGFTSLINYLSNLSSSNVITSFQTVNTAMNNFSYSINQAYLSIIVLKPPNIVSYLSTQKN